jgi:hypothetical protein
MVWNAKKNIHVEFPNRKFNMVPKGEIMVTDLKPETLFTEAPASWNTRYITPEGFICQITLRGDTGLVLLEKAQAALAFLLTHGYSPCEGNNNHHDRKDVRLCQIHHREMKRREKDGKSWYSHQLKEGGWCRGKQQGDGGKNE